jgi:hypothetical protein
MDRAASELTDAVGAAVGAAVNAALAQRAGGLLAQACASVHNAELQDARARAVELEARMAALERQHAADNAAAQARLAQAHAEGAALTERARRCEEGAARILEELNRAQQGHRLWRGSGAGAVDKLLQAIRAAELLAAGLAGGEAAGDECPRPAAAAARAHAAAPADDEPWGEQQASMAIECEKALPCQPPAARCPLSVPDVCHRQGGADERAARSPGALQRGDGGAGGREGHGGRRHEAGRSEQLVGAELGSRVPRDASRERLDGGRKRDKDGKQRASQDEAGDRVRSKERKTSRGEGGGKLSLASRRKSSRSPADNLSSGPSQNTSQQSSSSSGRSCMGASPHKQTGVHERGKGRVVFSTQRDADSKSVACGEQQARHGQSNDHRPCAAPAQKEPAGRNEKDALECRDKEALDTSSATIDGGGTQSELAKHNGDEVSEVLLCVCAAQKLSPLLPPVISEILRLTCAAVCAPTLLLLPCGSA